MSRWRCAAPPQRDLRIRLFARAAALVAGEASVLFYEDQRLLYDALLMLAQPPDQHFESAPTPGALIVRALRSMYIDAADAPRRASLARIQSHLGQRIATLQTTPEGLRLQFCQTRGD